MAGFPLALFGVGTLCIFRKPSSPMPDTFQSAVEKKIANPEAATAPDYGNRPDGSKKGKGWLGAIDLGDGNVATEYTSQSQSVLVDGKQIDFPTLVPTLTKEEIEEMRKVMAAGKNAPNPVMQKAVDHALKRLAEGKSVFAD